MTNEPVLKHIRITMLSERYEVAASLFDRVFGDLATQDPQPISETEEMQMGIYADAAEDSGSDYFVKPADPEVLRAKRTGEETDAIEKIELFTEGLMTVTPDGAFTEEPS